MCTLRAASSFLKEGREAFSSLGEAFGRTQGDVNNRGSKGQKGEEREGASLGVGGRVFV